MFIYSMKALACLADIPDKMQEIDYKITRVDSNIDNPQDNYPIDFLGIVRVPDYFLVGTQLINVNKMLKQPVEEKLNNYVGNAKDQSVNNFSIDDNYYVLFIGGDSISLNNNLANDINYFEYIKY